MLTMDGCAGDAQATLTQGSPTKRSGPLLTGQEAAAIPPDGSQELRRRRRTLPLSAGNAEVRVGMVVALPPGESRNEPTGLGDGCSAPRSGSRSTDGGHADAGRLRTTASGAGVEGAGVRRPIPGIAPLPSSRSQLEAAAYFRFDLSACRAVPNTRARIWREAGKRAGCSERHAMPTAR
jgi:hypothetical protein